MSETHLSFSRVAIDSNRERTLLVIVEMICWEDSWWASKASSEAVKEAKRDLCSGSVRVGVS
jgi:hypothetical protein